MADAETETTRKSAYVVLMHVVEHGDVGDYWLDQATIEARSAEDAIRQYGKEGLLVAIPTRSWKPVTVTARQTTTLDLKPAP